MSAVEFERVHVGASGDYDVVIGRGLLGEVGRRIRDAVPTCDDEILLVTDDNVGPLYADVVERGLEKAGFTVRPVELPAGEPTKCLDSYARLLACAAEAGLTRSSTVLALGGGVVGDLAGFVAATYMRGCHLVQVATSLLAMVDSSVGGKTAVDLPQGKNLVGSFYQPDLVVADLDCLATLPREYLSDGTGEVVKYGVMADAELFGWLERPLAGQEERVVARCVSIKRDVVEADEREGGVRKLLNLGHTVGHAIELLGEYRIPHGHAVAAGTAVMARACAAKGWCTAEDAGRVGAMLRVHGLPTGTRRPVEELVEAARHDKKRSGGTIDAVIIRGIGSTEIKRLSFAEFAELVELGCSTGEGVVFAEDDLPAPDGGTAIGNTPFDAFVRPGGLHGTVRAISSKSAAHRMLICAALADAPTVVHCTTTSQDIEATCDCLRALGAGIVRSGEDILVTPVRPAAAGPRPARAAAGALDCGESGSTLRFMLPVVCALGADCLLDGRGRLPQRPIEPLRTQLVEHGASVSKPGVWPIEVSGGMSGGTFDLPGDVSSQYVTGLLLALPLTRDGGTVRLHGTVESRPYIDMTVSAMGAFGVHVSEGTQDVTGRDGRPPETVATFSVAAGSRYTSPGRAEVEGDWSNAAFWLSAGALSPTPVRVEGLSFDSRQGDMRVLDALRLFGAFVLTDPEGGSATVCRLDPRTGQVCDLTGTTIDAHDVPDLVPVLGVVAACASGETRVVNAARLRIKESDRLQTTSEALRSLGAEVEELPDGLVIHGVGGSAEGFAPLHGCTVHAHGDHRIAMAASVAATCADDDVEVCGAQAVAKSYPGFFADLKSLGGVVRLVKKEVG